MATRLLTSGSCFLYSVDWVEGVVKYLEGSLYRLGRNTSLSAFVGVSALEG